MSPIKEVVYRTIHFNENAYLEELAEEDKLFEFNEDAYLTEQLEAEESLEADELSHEVDIQTRH